MANENADSVFKILFEFGIINEQQAVKAREILAQTTEGAKETGKLKTATDELAESENKGNEQAEKLQISHRALHLLFHQIGHETAPALGQAMVGALYGPIGLAIALGAALRGIEEASKNAEKAAEDFKKALDIGNDVKGATAAAGNFEDAVSKVAIAGYEYSKVMAEIEANQKTIKTTSDEAVKSLLEHAAAVDKLAQARLKSNKADIEAEFSGGKITKEEEIRRLNALEDDSAKSKTTRDEQTRAKEIELRRKELDETRQAAAVAAAAVPGAEANAGALGQGPERRQKLIQSLKDQIKAAEERDKGILEQIGPIGFADNSKTDFTSKLPGATSDEALRYQKGKAQIESDKALLDDLKAMLAKLDTPDSRQQYDVRAKKAEDDAKAAEKKAEDLARRVNELEAIVADKTRANLGESSVGAEVGRYEKHARDVTADAAVEAERQHEIDQAGQSAATTRRLADSNAPTIVDEAIKQIQANNKLTEELGKAASAAAREHSSSLTKITDALHELRAANAELAKRLDRSGR
jgi:hypothetical protein